MAQHRVSGESSLHPTVARKLIHRFQRSSDETQTEPLTARELKVLGLIAEGLSNHDIAKRLFISEPHLAFSSGAWASTWNAFASCFVLIGVTFSNSITLANPVRLLR